MATVNPIPSKTQGQRLLVDTGKLTVRKLTKSEGSLIAALGSLAPGRASNPFDPRRGAAVEEAQASSHHCRPIGAFDESNSVAAFQSSRSLSQTFSG